MFVVFTALTITWMSLNKTEHVADMWSTIEDVKIEIHYNLTTE